jgi:Flp pilus assembly protein TadB
LGTRVGGYVPQGLTTLPMPVFSIYFYKTSKQNKKVKIKLLKQKQKFKNIQKTKQNFFLKKKFKKSKKNFKNFKNSKNKTKITIVVLFFLLPFFSFVLTFGLVLCLLDLLVTELSCLSISFRYTFIYL